MEDFFGAEASAKLKSQMTDPGYAPSEMTKTEKEAVEKRKTAIDGLFRGDEELHGKYKIEICFEQFRSVHRPFAGSLTIFRSGSALGGDGDEVMYACPDDKCMGYIPPELISSIARRAACPKCEKVWYQNELYDKRIFKLTNDNWVHVMIKYFVRLNQDADIYVKTFLSDLRSETMKEKLKDCGGQKMEGARGKRVYLIYPLNRIYKDLSAGADLYSRFKAFLLS
ncbi:MAG: hypothetical protein ACXAEU_23885 [Candidatus Hodarchaeales archaeon]|jgi:hypothetical protein